MKKAILAVLFVMSFFFDISISNAYTISKSGGLFGGGAFVPVYSKSPKIISNNMNVEEYQKAIAKKLFRKSYSVEKAATKVNLNEEIKQIKTTKDKSLEVQIKEYLGLQWNFDCDTNVVEYFDENKIGSNLTLYFTPKEKGLTRIYFDLVTDDNQSEVLETRYLDVFIDKDIKDEEAKK